jgi:copper chaperone CopZ
MHIAIDGMHCNACVARVRKALEKVDGAHVRDVKVGSADVDLTPEKEFEAMEAIRKAGYQPQVAA